MWCVFRTHAKATSAVTETARPIMWWLLVYEMLTATVRALGLLVRRCESDVVALAHGVGHGDQNVVTLSLLLVSYFIALVRHNHAGNQQWTRVDICVEVFSEQFVFLHRARRADLDLFPWLSHWRRQGGSACMHARTDVQI